jgi:PAS domain S-box-containing protein
VRRAPPLRSGDYVKGNASVRISQALVGVVLAFMALILYKTSTDTIAVRTANDTRSLGSRVAQREAVRIDQTIAAIQTLKDGVDLTGFAPAPFISAARSTMRAAPMIDVIDYFNAEGQHVAHVDSSGQQHLGLPLRAGASRVPGAVINAVDLVLSESNVTRALTSSHALRIRRASDPPNAPGHLYVYVGQPLVRHFAVVGTIIARIDAQRLLVNDLAAVLPVHYVLDDGSGRLETGTPGGVGKTEAYVQTFSIPFADRAWSLTLAPPPTYQPAKPWLFWLLWLVAWLAVCVPIEVVGQINRRVQILNEGLEARVASRTTQLQASVAESQMLAAVVESVHEGVMLVDADGTVRYANDALCRELGCTLRDLVGRRAYDYAPLALSKRHLDELNESVKSRGFAYLETERVRTDGAKYWAGITLTRHGGGEGVGEGLIAVSRDVSDRRRLVDELVHAKDELERQMRVRADFIGTASHELRTPATTLRTLSALLGRKVLPRYEFSDEDAKLLGMLDFETRRLANLVDDLLEVAKVDATEAPLAESDVDISAIARAEVDSTFGLDAKAGPPISVRLPAAPAFVRADEHALRRIIVNLIGNARKFTPADGRVSVSVEGAGDRVRLVVADTGIGIPESDLPHVFERFYRVERPGTEIRGTGLGLAIVARLVERMHGVISISSEVGRGTTVSVEMPAAVSRSAAASA